MSRRRPAQRAGSTSNRLRILRRFVLGGLAVTVGAGLAAQPASAAGRGAGGAAAQPAASRPPRLVIYTNGGLSAAGIALYKQATGNYPVTVVQGSASQLAAKIESGRGKPAWDVLWMVGDGVPALLDRKGLLLRNWVTPAVKLNSVASRIEAKDHSYVPVGVTVAAAVVYNPAKVKTPPKSWKQLLDPVYRGTVGMVDPTKSPFAYPQVAGLAQSLGGVAQGEAFYQRLKANGLHVYPSDAATLSALGNGKLDVAVVQSSAGIGAALKAHSLKSQHSLRVAYLRPETVVPEVLAINAKLNAKQVEDARWFTGLMFSELGQHTLLTAEPTGTSLVWPVLAGEVGLPTMPPISTVPTQVIDAYAWAKRQPAIESWFTKHITA